MPKRLVYLPSDDGPTFDDQVDLIVSRLSSIGYDISRRDADAAWRAYSDSMCAGWLSVPDEPHAILESIRPHTAISW